MTIDRFVPELPGGRELSAPAGKMASSFCPRKRGTGRRECWRRGFATLLAAFLGACGPEPTTYTYKTVDGLEIKADVYRSSDGVARPVVMWIHGGALIFGNRGDLPGSLTRSLLDAGFVVVSIDYRLAPETKLPAIVEDLEDAFAWVRAAGPGLFHADTSRIAAMGASAGGYLALTSGFRTDPRPAAIVSFWGYGDLVGDWYSQPSEHPRHNEMEISPEAAHAQVTGPPISDPRDRNGNGKTFYHYTRQNGLWPLEVAGWDPQTQPERFLPYMPVMNVTSEYPPTMLIHGTDDTDVPYEQSRMMAAELERHGVAHELVTLPGAEHGFAWLLSPNRGRSLGAAVSWLNRHMRP